MLRSLAGAVALLFATAVAQAQTVTGVDFYEYGNYRSADPIQVKITREGFECTIVPNIYLIEQTHTVVAQVGVQIGFRFRIVGGPIGARVPIRLVAKFPPPGLLPPHGSRAVLSDEISNIETIGKNSFWTWELKDRSDLVPGIWTLEIWQGGRKLGEQKFNVILPPIS